MEHQKDSAPIHGSIFKFLADLFKRHDIKCLLVGGYALVANKVQRMTFDVDFLIELQAFKKIQPELNSAGYCIVHEQAAFIQMKSDLSGLRDLDFLISDRHTIEILLSQSRTTTIAGEEFAVPTPAHLIEMKLHSIAGNRHREAKDLPDIHQLILANNLGLHSDQIKNLFEKYDLADLYKKLLGAA